MDIKKEVKKNTTLIKIVKYITVDVENITIHEIENDF